MSHNVRLNGVKFANLNTLKAAVQELRNEGANIELVEGTGLIARAFGAGASDVPCDVLLRVNDGQWDVGFKLNERGEYIPELESMFRHRHLSATGNEAPVEGCRVDYGGIQIGQLTQRYALVQAEINAAQAGYSTTRTYDSAKRQFQLEVRAG